VIQIVLATQLRRLLLLRGGAGASRAHAELGHRVNVGLSGFRQALRILVRLLLPGHVLGDAPRNAGLDRSGDPHVSGARKMDTLVLPAIAITLADPGAARRAVRHLKRADPKLRRVIERVGPCRLEQKDGACFDYVTRAIVYQQLSGKAAATIYGRLQALYGGRPPTPPELSETSATRLRRAGLSRQKLGYLKDLARQALSGAVPFDTLEALPDEAVIEALTAIRGVGVWTAQMFLMFRLGRLDVLPVQDLGIQRGMRRLYGLRRTPTPAQMERIAMAWRPYRSIACWYLWRSLEITLA
jgi:DNA-3-methyladenine glycosylase II